MHLSKNSPRTTMIFRTSSANGLWRVSRDGDLLASYWSEGDARRGACLAARRAEREGWPARVLTSAGDTVIPHNEPQFGR